ncbi:hypothetical protein [Mycobacterium syngnathidarum]
MDHFAGRFTGPEGDDVTGGDLVDATCGVALIFVVPSLVAAIAAIAGAVITVRGQRKGQDRWKGDRKILGDIHKQAVNDHPPDENLRDQIDRMEAAQNLMAEQFDEIRDWQIEHGRDLRGIRSDVGRYAARTAPRKPHTMTWCAGSTRSSAASTLGQIRCDRSPA